MTNKVIVQARQAIHRLVEPIPGNRLLGSLNVLKFGHCFKTYKKLTEKQKENRFRDKGVHYRRGSAGKDKHCQKEREF
jgi:hypothetical protein